MNAIAIHKSGRGVKNRSEKNHSVKNHSEKNQCEEPQCEEPQPLPDISFLRHPQLSTAEGKVGISRILHITHLGAVSVF
ncbi:unnamed protein product [Boreogadus saida]